MFEKAIQSWIDLYHQSQCPWIFDRVKYVPPEEREKPKIIMEKEVIREKIIERIKMAILIENIKELFPQSYRQSLLFGEDENRWIVKLPYYDREKFIQMLNIVKNEGSRYLSQGSESHFWIPKKNGRLAYNVYT